jgi:hypothetical protein
MAKVSPSQRVLAEIEFFLEVGKPEDARVLLAFLDHDAFDRESRLRLLLINVRLDGPEAYQDEIDQLSDISELVGTEKELVERILFETRRKTSERAAQARHSEKFSESSKKSDDSEQLLRDRGVELQASLDHVTALERRVKELQALLQQRDAHTALIESQAAELAAQLEALNRTHDAEIAKLQEEVRLKAESFQESEAAFADERQRLAERVSILESHVNEAQSAVSMREGELVRAKTRLNELTQEAEDKSVLESRLAGAVDLLASRQSEVESLKARIAELVGEADRMEMQLHETRQIVAQRSGEMNSLALSLRELSQEKAELLSEREIAERGMKEQLRDQLRVIQVMEASVKKIEAQNDKQIRVLKRQLSAQQNLLERDRAEMSDLRNQICVLNQRVVESDAAKLYAESLRVKAQKEREGLVARRHQNMGMGSQAIAASEIVQTPVISQDTRVPWIIRWRSLTPGQWSTSGICRAALPAAAVCLLLIPVGYILLGHTSTGPTPSAKVQWKSEFQTSQVAKPERESIDLTGGDEERKDIATNGVRVADQKVRKPGIANAHSARNSNDDRYVTRRAVALREQPRYAARAKAEIGAGTSVSVLGEQGSWLRVKTRQSGDIGYVRKEYLVLARSAR